MSGTALALSVALLFGLASIVPVVSEAETQPSRPDARRTYPDFALQPPRVNTSPGPEYASSTRMFQGIPSIERTAKGR
jgi:hypothetical protein